jgi:hypothetical protein
VQSQFPELLPVHRSSLVRSSSRESAGHPLGPVLAWRGALIGVEIDRSGRRQGGRATPGLLPAVITADLLDRAHKSIATRVNITAEGKITGKFPGPHRFPPPISSQVLSGTPTTACRCITVTKASAIAPRVRTNSKDVNGHSQFPLLQVREGFSVLAGRSRLVHRDRCRGHRRH